MTERNDGDRIIVTGYSAGSHFPREQRQLNYTWEANGLSEEGPFHVEGSVYGRSLRMRGPGTVVGSVLGRGDVQLDNPGPGLQRFLSGLSASGNIACKPETMALEQTVVGDIRKARYAIRGDVLAENVSLDGAIVLGNIEAVSVSLRHCIVFGAIVAHETLQMTASTALYYHARDVVIEGPCTLLNAMGESATMPVFATYQDGAGALWDADVRFYPVFRGTGSAPLTNRPWEPPTDGWQQAKLYPRCDWIQVPAFTGAETRKGPSKTDRVVLTIAGRALNFSVIEGNLKALYHLLRSGLEFEHYAPDTREEVVRTWTDTCTDDELFLMLTVNARDDTAAAPADTARRAATPIP